jgi:HEAT repeat protein
MRKTAGMNRHQKAAHKVGEKRLGADELPRLLVMAESQDPEERLTAAEFLCPCHVRRRVEAAWDALYRLLVDPDVRVRRAAWHTLEDGGRPEDPALDAILKRTLAEETDSRVLSFAKQVAGPRARQADAVEAALSRPVKRDRGRCDFCGEDDRFVEWETTTMIPTSGLPRVALICDACAA